MRILKSRTHHWTCSKFANWIRGEDKPHALEWSKWTEWKNEQKKQRPFRYWLSDTFLSKLQNIVYFPSDVYHTIKIYIRNRYIDKIQYLRTGLKSGQYYDFDYRLIHALFNELVDFVELELSSSMRWDSNKKYKFVKGRCQEAQDDYFRWANHLKHQGRLTEQAKASRKIKELYEWWKYLRPQRVDPYSSSKFSYDIDEILDGKKIKEKQKSYQKAYDLEEKYDNEDTKMLIELIKVRNHLWI
jgi:hypothetical protein